MLSAGPHFDVVVAGVGGMGSAACLHLARRGKRVLGLEQFDVPHALGSSHGVNRIIRLAYAEGSGYVPLLRRAYELWYELEESAGEQLLRKTGYVDIGEEMVRPSVEASVEHELPHELIDGRELMRRHPGYRVPDDVPVLYQPDGGFVLAERSIVAHVVQAQAHGAEIHARERVIGWEPREGGGVRVNTERGTYTCDRLVVAAGAWAAAVGRLDEEMVVAERQVLGWFQPKDPSLFGLDRFPCFALAVDGSLYYGFPIFGIPGFKIGLLHHRHERVDPDDFDREPGRADEEALRPAVERYFPQAAGPTMTLSTCLFENSPDETFLIDVHPECEDVVVAAGFSGHGYKFCPVVGEVVADIVVDGATRHDVAFLRFDRLREAETTTKPPGR